ncbi:MAG TPA: hypothetical protein VHO06_15800 [Polyangia bacterium]|nr:hypothetical protein [Polyangia bacterium]
MRIYIASRYDRRFEMLGVTGVLMRAGHHVTSRWIEGRGDGPEVAAAEDLEDVLRAECLVSFTEEPQQAVSWAARGGRHVEFGVALGAGKRLCVVGPRENIFHYLPRVEVFGSLDALVGALAVPPRRP